MENEDKAYAIDEIAKLVDKSIHLTSTQKSIINTFINASFQAIYNASMNENGPKEFITDRKCECDIWEFFYNQTIQSINIVNFIDDTI